MGNYTTIETGAPSAWDGKSFVEGDLALENLGMSVNTTAPGEGSAFWHRHARLEELYIFLDGHGELAIDDEVVAVEPGTMVKVGLDAWRALRCSPDSAVPLRWLCVRAGADTLAGVGRDAELDRERPFPWSA